MVAESDVNYVVWQNRAFRFYLAARLLHHHGLFAPAVFSGTQALELLLKATLVYWDKSFHPEAAGHALAKLVRSVRNKAPGAKAFDMPRYFFEEQRYHIASRYPSNEKGINVPASFLTDLDFIFTSLVAFVPFQHNTELKRVLAGRKSRALPALRFRNKAIRGLRKILSVKAPSSTTQRPLS